MQTRPLAPLVASLVAFAISGCGAQTPTAEQIRQSVNAQAHASATANSGGSTDDGGSYVALPERRPYHFDGHGANVSAGRFGKKWPLTVRSGRVNCIGTGAVWVVFTANDGTRYAVNGLARQQEATEGFKDIRKIWADNPQISGTKKDISPLIDICAPLMK